MDQPPQEESTMSTHFYVASTYAAVVALAVFFMLAGSGVIQPL